MKDEKYLVTQYSINAILSFIEIGDFVIPEIQRPFVWKRRDLIDSLFHGYPPGYLIEDYFEFLKIRRTLMTKKIEEYFAL